MIIMNSIIIINLPSGPDHEKELLNVSHSMENSTMLVPGMAEPGAQSPPLLEPPIDTLMPGTSESFPSFRLWAIKVSPGGIKVAGVATVSLIGNGPLIPFEHVHKRIQGNSQVRPLTRSKGAINPYNPASLDADANFVPYARPIELLGVPPFAKRSRLLDAKVSAIDGNFCRSATEPKRSRTVRCVTQVLS